MKKSRLEAFSDGVLAIIITIMVLELSTPESPDINALLALWPQLSSYALSFVFLGIYWNNHHHLLQSVERVNGKVLWANLHLLFWLSLVPFATAWTGSSGFSRWPVFVYGAVLLGAACAYFILVRTLLGLHGSASQLAVALGSDAKGKLSVLIYVVALGASLIAPFVACGIYVLVAAMWLVPDQRIERTLGSE